MVEFPRVEMRRRRTNHMMGRSLRNAARSGLLVGIRPRVKRCPREFRQLAKARDGMPGLSS